MEAIFAETFGAMFMAVAQIFLIILLAGFLVKRSIIKQEHVTGLSQTTVMVFLPAMVFSNTIKMFNPDVLPNWWIIPLSGTLVSLIGVGIAALLFLPSLRQKRNLLPLAGFQNAGYLVLPIGKILYPTQFDEFALYTFLFILAFNPVLWSLGKVLTTSDVSMAKVKFTDFITPPVVSNLLSLALVLTGMHVHVPMVIVDSVKLVGDATVPVATFVLGAALGSISLASFPNLWDTSRILLVKYGLLPATIVGILFYTRTYVDQPLLADFYVIEASAAPATAIILQLRAYGGDIQRIGSIMFITYIFSLFMMPLWLSVWKLLIM